VFLCFLQLFAAACGSQFALVVGPSSLAKPAIFLGSPPQELSCESSSSQISLFTWPPVLADDRPTPDDHD
jgi:hypothetical protein